MMHFDMAYRVLIEARRGSDGRTPVAAMNGLLASFMDQCYWETQVLAVCRLIDKRKDVISIRRLLDDVRVHCHLLTRENYVGYDGLPYEPRIGSGSGGLLSPESDGLLSPGSDEEKNFRSWARHQEFDQLSGVSPERRSRSDCIRCQVFKTIEGYLDKVDEDGLIKLRNKFIAHAADLGSRGSQVYSGPSAEFLEKVANAQRQILCALREISSLLPRFEKTDRIPHPSPGFLNGLEKPYSCVAIADLQKKWDELSDERREWCA
jgi:AbiU2